jgi:hypothetical protein
MACQFVRLVTGEIALRKDSDNMFKHKHHPILHSGFKTFARARCIPAPDSNAAFSLFVAVLIGAMIVWFFGNAFLP